MMFGAAFLVALLQSVSAEPVDGAFATSVEVIELSRAPLIEWHYAEGVAQAQSKEFLQFENAGRVTFIADDDDGRPLREGSRVSGPVDGGRLGQLIARLDERTVAAEVAQMDADLRAARRRLEVAEAQLAKARADFQRKSQLYEKQLTPRAVFEASENDLRAAEAQVREAEASAASVGAQVDSARLGLERSGVFAPFDGVISLMNIREGDYVSGPTLDQDRAARESAAAVVVMDDSQFEVELFMPPYEADYIEVGDRVYVATLATDIAAHVRGADSPRVLEGEIWSVSPSISLRRRAVTMKARVKSRPNVLRDGAYVSVWIAAEERPDALVAPHNAVITQGERSFVYVVDPASSQVDLREVRLGLYGLDAVELLEGVTDDELIVVAGQHRLQDGAAVRILTPDGDRP